MPAVAHAQQRDQREIHAQELFVLGRYQDALAIYGKLYAETNHPTYLRNIGRCYQKMDDPDKALDSFREYLQKAKNLPADQREVIEG
jgi:tetratricopeptide (TPR) repeat protein